MIKELQNSDLAQLPSVATAEIIGRIQKGQTLKKEDLLSLEKSLINSLASLAILVSAVKDEDNVAEGSHVTAIIKTLKSVIRNLEKQSKEVSH